MSVFYTTLIIFVITYLGIIFTRLPKINIDRPSAAFFGAVAMIVFGVLSFEEAIAAIDFNTIALLLGMMIVIATLQLDGFFSYIAQKTIKYSKNQSTLLYIITFITGISSAFLVNDAVVLLFTPVIILICKNAKINPIPYLIAEILSANIGSAMSITGNPQNMLIGINSSISYSKFLLLLMPISLIGMWTSALVVKLFYKKQFSNNNKLEISEDVCFAYDFKSMKFSVPIFLGVIVLFFLSSYIKLSIPIIALMGASLILIFGKIKPSKVIKEVDWVLLLFFASLFIVVHAVEKEGLLNIFMQNNLLSTDFKGIISLHGFSVVMSQIVSNVPYTIVMLAPMKEINSELLWLALASASTLAGNATIIGAMANLIVLESAEKYKVSIKFWEFAKIGIIATLISIIFSIIILWIEFYFGLIN